MLSLLYIVAFLATSGLAVHERSMANPALCPIGRPCGPIKICPDDQELCGRICCANWQECVGNTCKKACPDSRPKCGNYCCGSGLVCSLGACIPPSCVGRNLCAVSGGCCPLGRQCDVDGGRCL